MNFSLTEVSKRYNCTDDQRWPLKGVNLQIQENEFVTIVGPSGCGKTTLLNIMAGLVFPDAGRVELNGQLIKGPGKDRAVVFQKHALYEWLSAGANVEFGLKMRGVPKKERRVIAEKQLAVVGLESCYDSKVYEMSGGMQQRVGLARALANDPDVILLDEPMAAVDQIMRTTLQTTLRELWKRTGKTFILITHSIEEALFLGSRVIVMRPNPGRIVGEYSPLFTWDALDGASIKDIKRRATFVDVYDRIENQIAGVGEYGDNDTPPMLLNDNDSTSVEMNLA